ncbi:MAG TPA: ADP-ribosylglycohydrolase family protein [Gammaproteobacteria bacterium]|nr:ADP-ribosylglycohydrolase family protein [Gammaproteobacteria bacterium]
MTPRGSSVRDRYRGALLGLAVGDAIGAAVEFRPPGTFEKVTGMTGGGPHDLAPGQWTDDTSMALCLAESLIECRGFDAEDQMRRYLRWYRDGYLSSTGRCFDIGNTVRSALHRFEAAGDPFAGSTDPRYGGNGSLMRLAPIALAFADDPRLAMEKAAEMSRTTHAAPEPVDACRYFAGLIVGALQGANKATLLAPRYAPISDAWARAPLAPAIEAIADGSFKTRQPPDIRGSGYVVRTLEAALWAFWHSESFAEGLLEVVNLGEDADTTGAVYGQLAGTYYGCEAVPKRWRGRLAQRDLVERLADGLGDF